MKEVTVLGIDLAKNIFQIHGINRQGQIIVRKQIRRNLLLSYIRQLSPCLIGMEACGGAHFWAREFRKLGHTVKLISPQYVKPYVKTNKNDARDAEAICEAVSRPNMRFVPIKETWQQDMLCQHRVRQQLVKQRTALINELHALGLEYGFVFKGSGQSLFREITLLLDPSSDEISEMLKETFRLLLDHVQTVELRLENLTKKIEAFAKSDETCKRIQTIPGVGVLTSTAIVSSVGDPHEFKNGRQMSAWLGLVPRQNSSGGKQVLLGISKRGDGYLRRLLIHGARSVLCNSKNLEDPVKKWAKSKEEGRGHNRAAVALANKNARIILALLMEPGKKYEVTKIA